MDLGILLMEFGICLDWRDISEKEDKPKMIRQIDMNTCNCIHCCFYKECITDRFVIQRGRVTLKNGIYVQSSEKI